MFIAKRFLETKYGVFKKGEEVSEKIAKEYFRYVEEIVDGKPTLEKDEELLFEIPSKIEIEKIEVSEDKVSEDKVSEVKEPKKSKRTKKKSKEKYEGPTPTNGGEAEKTEF